MKFRRSITTALAGGILAVGGAGVALAVSSSNDEQGQTVTAEAAASSVESPVADKPVVLPRSAARQQEAINEVRLLSVGEDSDNRPASDLVPPFNPHSSSSLDRDDLKLAREIPGRSGSWLVPLETGGYGLLSDTGSIEFAPGQLEAGQVVEALVHEDGKIVVFGIVTNGIDTVAISSASGEVQPIPVADNAFVKSYDASTSRQDRPVAVSGTGTDKSVALAGILPDGTIVP